MGRSKQFYDLFMRLWPLSKVAFRLAHKPVFSLLLRPFFSTEYNQATYIPINEVVGSSENTILPFSLLVPLIEQASARFLMNECLCRTHEDCSTYPHDLGCIFLGDGAAQISPTMGRIVSVEEAIEHIRQTMKLGLLPLIVHTAFDAFTLKIPHSRMLTVCFCCDCCCAVRQGLRLAPQPFQEIVRPLPGLKVEVGDECILCGLCLETCDLNAISINHHSAIVGSECIGCGRCAEVCPTGAIRLCIPENGFVMQGLWSRIQTQTDIRPAFSEMNPQSEQNETLRCGNPPQD